MHKGKCLGYMAQHMHAIKPDENTPEYDAWYKIVRAIGANLGSKYDLRWEAACVEGLETFPASDRPRYRKSGR